MKRELETFENEEVVWGADTFCGSIIDDTWDDEECIHEDEGPVVNDAKVEGEHKDLTTRVGRLRR
jgi:hypothetical protein